VHRWCGKGVGETFHVDKQPYSSPEEIESHSMMFSP
jgi:uncharacterized Fe-S cluster protein YjdI